MLGLQKVPQVHSIQVYGIGKLESDHLALYFESREGVEDASVELHAADDYAVVHFSDSNRKKCLHTFTFYRSDLIMNLYGVGQNN